MNNDETYIVAHAKVGIYRIERWLAQQLDTGVRPDDPRLFNLSEE